MAVVFTSIGKNEGTAMAIALSAGMGLMAVPPAIVPILQIPFLIGYVKIANKIKALYGETQLVGKLVPDYSHESLEDALEEVEVEEEEEKF